ncbi:Heme exporter protein D [Hahella chejuensis KCTC 2396]|uniref:Heme exporter protein D n=1 Tax=Hahella chejuensis (strain KCTC 2396) TaxID=349521 RepID=Q2SE52_HAHCH|nr:heme exporter protein CcmD [Hahella chejuensis]ABC31072.1 Heme exporter protein D [Hahella chejuensis KCTC 2396]
MNFESLNEFFAMGGHGLYVWLAYGAGGLVFLYNLAAPKLKRDGLVKRLSQQYRREKASQ